jgi:hypothetical protein
VKRTPLVRRTPLRPRSARRAALYRTVRVPIVKRLLLVYPTCQFPGGCTERAVDVHELRKRSQGGSLSDLDNLRTSCRFHNEYAEAEPLLCAELGWVRRSAA